MQERRRDKTLEITTHILGSQDVDAILKMIVDSVTDDFGFEACDAFLLDETRDNFVLKVSKGFPSDIENKVAGFTISKDFLNENLAASQKLGRFTYLYKSKPGETGASYYSVLHADRAALPRAHDGDWHELDVLYVLFEDANGKAIGLLEPDGPRDHKLPSPDLVQNLELFSSLVSIAVANAKLVAQLNRTVKLFRALLDTAVSLQQTADLKDTLRKIADTLNDLVPFDEVSVYLVDWNKGLLIPIYATGPYAGDVMADIGPISGLAGEVARLGKVDIVEDSIDDQRVENIPGIEDLEIRQTIMAIPLKGRHGVEGVLELYRDKSKKFTSVEWAVAEPFAAHAAIAIENARLREEQTQNLEATQKAYEDMKDLDKMKDSLVDTISHELRTPLTTILGYVEMASAGMYGDITPKMKDKFGNILEQVNRINMLVSTMLEMSRLQKKTLALEFEPANVAMVTREVVEDLDREIKSKNHTVTILFGNDLPIVNADRMRIHDVISNLVGNAVKYTNPGGKITIGADILGGKVHLWVRDNGIGIADEDHDKLFNRFFLADAGLIREDGRIGIGLYTSREIVRRHGGEMWFESRKGSGSTFHVTLPLKVQS
ncbi:MAG: GAF domain-containing sensor histidine kinase [Candidatus Thermoplasmatota archaeon]|nr:GAF domain-containing sensor histidine kinase [Candidatus Thermoplasmatota archaeon]